MKIFTNYYNQKYNTRGVRMTSLIGNHPTLWGDMKRVVIAPDHSIVGYLNESDSDKWDDGSDVDWSSVESDGHNVMVQIPKFYYTKYIVGDRVYFGVADSIPSGLDVPDTEWELHPAFFRDRAKHLDDSSANPTEVDYRYVGAFHGWVDSSNRLRSLPNKIPTVNETIGTFRNYAKNNGVGWSQWDYYLLYAIQMLYITEYGHPDSQTTIGRGYVDGNSSSINTGGTLQYGNNTYGETTGKEQMSYRGIEDFYGNVYNFIDGVYSDFNRRVMVSNKNFNNNGDGYETIGESYSSNLSGYIGDIQPHKETGFIIGGTGGSSSSHLYDYGFLASYRRARFGGAWSSGADAGAFLLRLIVSGSSSDSNSAARLAL